MQRDLFPLLVFAADTVTHTMHCFGLFSVPLAMEGTSTKMSASAIANTVFLTDTPEMIHEKVCSMVSQTRPAASVSFGISETRF